MSRKPLLRAAAVCAAALLALPLMAEDALSLVPANAVTVGMVKLRDLRTSPLGSMLFQQTDKMSTDGEAAQFLADAGLSPSRDVDVLVVSTTPRTNLGSDADVLVVAEGRFNVERMKEALIARHAVQKESYFLLPDDNATDDHESGAVAFPSSSLAVMGNEHSVAAALAARAAGGTGFRGSSGLSMDLGRIDRNATAWALIDVVRAARLTKSPAVNSGGSTQSQALTSALRSVTTLALWATDKGDSLALGAFGMSRDEETLQLLEDTARGALAAMRLAVKDKAPDMVSTLRRFDVSRSRDAVKIEGSISADTVRELMAKKRASLK